MAFCPMHSSINPASDPATTPHNTFSSCIYCRMQTTWPSSWVKISCAARLWSTCAALAPPGGLRPPHSPARGIAAAASETPRWASHWAAAREYAAAPIVRASKYHTVVAIASPHLGFGDTVLAHHVAGDNTHGATLAHHAMHQNCATHTTPERMPGTTHSTRRHATPFPPPLTASSINLCASANVSRIF